MVGLSLKLSLAAILSTVILASPSSKDGLVPSGNTVAPILIPSSLPPLHIASPTTQSPHAIRERSTSLTEEQPGYEPDPPRGEEEEIYGEGWGGAEEGDEEDEEKGGETEDPLAPRRRTVRNCYRSPFFFTRRSALDKNFMRFGRSGRATTGEEAPTVSDDTNKATDLIRLGRDRNFIRLGRSVGGDNNFIRLGRTPIDHVVGEEGEAGESELDDKGRTMAIRGSLNNFMRFGRKSADRNFIRLGRSQGSENTVVDPGTEEREQGEVDREREGDFARFSRDRLDRNFMRFGRGSGNNFMRFGRGPNNNFMRFGRGPNNNFMRFGRGPNNNFMRFGRGPSNNFMRFGRGPNNNFMRFGRGSGNNFLRFGRDTEKAEDPSGDFLRLGRSGSDSRTDDGDTMSRVYRWNLDRNFMRLGRSNNKNFIRFGRGAGNNFMRFGREGEIEEEDDNGVEAPGKDVLGNFNDGSEAKESDTSEGEGLKIGFADKSVGKETGGGHEIASRSKRSVVEDEDRDPSHPFEPSAEETMAYPYGSPSLAASSPLSAYLFSPDLLLLSSLDKDSAGEGERERRGGKSNFIRFG